jgi:hypothetical protein
MVRINGRMKRTRLTRPYIKLTRISPTLRHEEPKKKKRVTVTGTGSKRSKKRHKKQQLRYTEPVPVATTETDHELLHDLGMQAVRELIRDGHDRETAMDMVFGFTPDWAEEIEREEDAMLYAGVGESLYQDENGNYEWR